jgi:hypothetical protein
MNSNPSSGPEQNGNRTPGYGLWLSLTGVRQNAERSSAFSFAENSCNAEQHKCYSQLKMNPRPLDETDIYVLFQEFEDVFLFEKDSNSELWRTSMYGDAICGLIGLSNEWVIAGGAELILWKNNHLKFIQDKDLQWVYDVRHTGENEVQLLTDPWKENAAVWRFDILTEEKNKIRDFPDYLTKEYTDKVEW